MTEPRRIAVLGSTGSIGTQALEVAQHSPDRFEVVAVAAGGRDVAALAAQVCRWRVPVVGIGRAERAAELVERIEAGWPGGAPEIVTGPAATTRLAQLDCDVVLNAVDGSQGLRATVAALDAGRTVALANKESLVAGGTLVTDRAKPGQIIPVDSEHSALAQALRSGSAAEVAKLVVTASGGPFRGRTRAELADVTPAQAMRHPTWAMGHLITTNSATLVNKGLEIIEAHLLFDVPYERIDVVVHPQSVVHSMVEFVDGSTLAQASPPDMRLTIALALGWPHRVPGAAAAVDWTQAQTWTFEPLDDAVFPAVSLARTVGAAGGLAPAVFNAANETLVAAFHDGAIGFLGIVDLLGRVVETWLSDEQAARGNPGTVADVEDAEAWARSHASALVSAV